MGIKIKFFIDFDGTVVADDVCASMVMKYAGDGWNELNALWEQGVLTTGECAQRTLDLMQVSPAELDAYFSGFELAPGFQLFVDWASERQYPILILSDGYDNYIKLIQKKYNLDIDYFANHLEYKGGWQFQSVHSNPDCLKCGVCKNGLVQERLEPGVTSIYIGDGYSDRCAAAICDVVFAKKSLATYCEQEGIDYISYQDFNEIVRHLDEMAKAEK